MLLSGAVTVVDFAVLHVRIAFMHSWALEHARRPDWTFIASSRLQSGGRVRGHPGWRGDGLTRNRSGGYLKPRVAGTPD